MKTMSTLLWLDDIRNPYNDNWITDYAPDFIDNISNVTWVKSYNEFTNWIIENGLPDMIAFDHDLGEDESIIRVRGGVSKRKSRSIKRETKSGMDCAKFLVEYLLDNNLPAPRFVIQSSNPAGALNINTLLTNYQKQYGQ